MSDAEKTSEIVNAVATLAKAVPVYDDALKPLAQETGKALSTVGKTVNVALAPIRGFVWGAEKIEEWLATKVTSKLEGVPEDEIETPDLAVAGPLIEALKFSGHKPEISEMFAGLLAGSMKAGDKDKAHPTFVNMIKSMTAIDAKIFASICNEPATPTIDIKRNNPNIRGTTPVHSFFNPTFVSIVAGYGIPGSEQLSFVQCSIENLDRLGLVQATSEGSLTAPLNEVRYKEIETGPILEQFRIAQKNQNYSFDFSRSFVRLTQTGRNFKDIIF